MTNKGIKQKYEKNIFGSLVPGWSFKYLTFLLEWKMIYYYQAFSINISFIFGQIYSTHLETLEYWLNTSPIQPTYKVFWVIIENIYIAFLSTKYRKLFFDHSILTTMGWLEWIYSRNSWLDQRHYIRWGTFTFLNQKRQLGRTKGRVRS